VDDHNKDANSVLQSPPPAFQPGIRASVQKPNLHYKKGVGETKNRIIVKYERGNFRD